MLGRCVLRVGGSGDTLPGTSTVVRRKRTTVMYFERSN